MKEHPSTIAFRIRPDPHVCREVREEVSAFATGHAIARDDLEDFQTALGEAVANAIEHGRSTAEIAIAVSVERGSIVAEVADSGVGFVVDPRAGSTLPESIAERGRGFPIMRRCSDIFAVNSAPGRGTTVRIERFLADRRLAG